MRCGVRGGLHVEVNFAAFTGEILGIEFSRSLDERGDIVVPLQEPGDFGGIEHSARDEVPLVTEKSHLLFGQLDQEAGSVLGSV